MCRVVSPPCSCKLENSPSGVAAADISGAHWLPPLYDPGSESPCGPAKCRFKTSMSSFPRGLRPSCALYEAGVKDPETAARSLLSGLAKRSLWPLAAVPCLGGDWPYAPRNAWESEEAPGPGSDVGDAPASGVSLPWLCGSCVPRLGEPNSGLARRAVVELLDGEAESADSVRWWLNEPDGTGRPRPSLEGFSLFSFISAVVTKGSAAFAAIFRTSPICTDDVAHMRLVVQAQSPASGALSGCPHVSSISHAQEQRKSSNGAGPRSHNVSIRSLLCFTFGPSRRRRHLGSVFAAAAASLHFLPR